MDKLSYLKQTIKSIPDFPKEGILFRDITSLCEDPKAFPMLVELMAEPFKELNISKVAATEARGFVFGAAVAQYLKCGLVLVRKPGKLPREVYSEDYTLEYGTSTLQIHKDAINEKDNVLVVDDLIATGGTIDATISLVKKCGGNVKGISFAITLPDIGGEKLIRDKYPEVKIVTVLDFPGH
jgi:adenine phosphoribosyltransferase